MIKPILFASVSLIAFSAAAVADESVCALSKIVNGSPRAWENKVVNRDALFELTTTDGTFKGKVIYQPDLDGWSLSIKSGDSSSAGFFDGTSKSAVLSLNAQGSRAQINCHFN